MEVMCGRAIFNVDGKEIILSAGDAPLTLPRYSVHSVNVPKGEKVVVREKTIPPGEFKALFFQDLHQNGEPSFLLVMRAFYDGNSYPALPGNIKLVDKLVSG